MLRSLKAVFVLGTLVVCGVAWLGLLSAADVDVASGQEGQSHQFQAEVVDMLNIIVNNLYTLKEIFLRELISNASDALDKARIEALSRPGILDGDNVHGAAHFAASRLNITIIPDRDNHRLIVQDTGIGMNKTDMTNYLGTLARSGTKAFVNSLPTEGKPVEQHQIGQFGVGFYSVFLVADKVSVESKRIEDDVQYTWSCNITDPRFFVSSSTPDKSTVGTSYTRVILSLKETNEEDYLSEQILTNLVRKYSEFINFPIYLYSTKTTTEEVPIDPSEEQDPAAEPAAEPGADAGEDLEKKKADGADDKIEVEDAKTDEGDKDAAKDKPKTKSVTKVTNEYILVNSVRPIWTRDIREVTQREYEEFYASHTKDSGKPLGHSHFRADTKFTEIKALIFIPPNPSFKPFSKDEPGKFLSLYVKRVFITDQFPDFPRYLSFIKAIVDAEEISLNVSREMLQKHRTLVAIKDRVVSKTLDIIKSMTENITAYENFYNKYAGHLKLGIITDEDNKNKLAKLLRYPSSFTDGKNMTSYDDYIERMKANKPNQKDIFYVTGGSLREMKALPYVERVISKGHEVLYMDDQFDEYALQTLREYDGHSLKNLAKAGVKLSDENEDEKKKFEADTAAYKALTDKMQKLLTAKIGSVVISELLEKSPVAIVASEYGWSPAMEKMMKGNKDDPMMSFFGKQKRIMQINPSHPLIVGLNEKIKDEDADSQAQLELHIRLLYDTALLRSGYELTDTPTFAHRVEELMRSKLGMAPVAEADKPVEEEEPEDPNAFDFSSLMNSADKLKNMGDGAGAGAGGLDMDDLNDLENSAAGAADHTAATEDGQGAEDGEKLEL